MVIVDAQTRTFFDEVIYDQCPDLLFHFQNFEQESWKLPMDLPDLATRALRFSKTSIEGALESYLRLPNDKRPNESWIISTLCEDLDKLCLDATQKAHILFSFYRV
jgi:cholesterol 7alpha-monooxygenase